MSNEQSISRFHGVYGIPEAARYLVITPPLTNGYAVDPARLRYWIRTSVSPPIIPEVPTRQRLITFRDLISMRMIAVLRSRGVQLREIRETERWMRQTLNIDWPFVSQPLWTYSSDVYTKFEEHLIAASRFGQQAMAFVEEWLSKVEIDMTFDVNDLASSWSPYDDVRINPRVQFGEPCIDGTRIPTSVIWSKIRAGDNPSVVASLYGITRTQTQRAVEWEERLAAA